MYFNNWKGTWKHAAQEEFNVILQKELDKDNLIIDGSFNRTIE